MTNGSGLRPLVIRGAVSVRSPHGDFQLEGAGDHLRIRLPESLGHPRGVGELRRLFGLWRFVRRHRSSAEALSRKLSGYGIAGEVALTKRMAVRFGPHASSRSWSGRLLGLGDAQIVRREKNRKERNEDGK